MSFVLVIVIFAGLGSGGVAINTDLRFFTEDLCEAAAAKIKATNREARLICVRIRQQ